jgi:cell division initiation protein
MNITPLEIRQKTFEKNFRGYDKDEVEAYLLSLSQEWERQQDIMRELKVRLEIAEKEVQKLREVESSLFKTLKTAEDTGSNLIAQASQKAELQLGEARLKAEQILQEAGQQAHTIRQKADAYVQQVKDDLRQEIQEAEAAYKALESHKQQVADDLLHLAQETLSKVEKWNNSGVKPDLKAILKHPSLDSEAPANLPVEKVPTNTANSKQEAEPKAEDKVKTAPLAKSTSFFDEIDG